jgi:hypothetical protein
MPALNIDEKTEYDVSGIAVLPAAARRECHLVLGDERQQARGRHRIVPPPRPAPADLGVSGTPDV